MLPINKKGAQVFLEANVHQTAWTECWHLSKALLHLSQAWFTVGFTGDLTKCTPRDVIQGLHAECQCLGPDSHLSCFL